MGALPGFQKGTFPGQWRIEKTMASATIGACWPGDRFDVPRILDAVAPDEASWRFLYYRAMVLRDGSSWFPDANAWRQALLETVAWGRP